MPGSTLTVKTSVYEGPLDLLLELIEKRKLLINDISLASVTDEYISRINALDEMPVGETAEFIALAATLLLIKSRSLLPTLEISDEESQDIKQLEYRLAMYQIVKEASRELGKHFGEAALYEGRSPELPPIFVPDPSATPSGLQGAAKALIEGFPTQIALPRVNVKKIISIEEVIDNLAKRVASAMSLSFREFTGKHSKPEMIVSFLAMLELVKQGILKATQLEGDIKLESDAPGTPSYE